MAQKSGYVAIVGEPNAGKSTLLNRLLRTRLSPVTKKPQTTRNRILGILTEDDYQCCFLDTPGIIDPAYPLQEQMVSQIKSALADADIVIWMIQPGFDPDNFPRPFVKLDGKKPVIAVINKIDRAGEAEIAQTAAGIRRLGIRYVVPVSAIRDENIGELKSLIRRLLPESPFIYPAEDLSDRPVRFFVAEIIREKIFKHFREEIPYSTCVTIEDYRERPAAKDLIRAVIYVERDSQRGILIGAGGRALKKIGELARQAIEDFVDRPVYLELRVKVKEKWRKNKKFLKELGL